MCQLDAVFYQIYKSVHRSPRYSLLQHPRPLRHTGFSRLGKIWGNALTCSSLPVSALAYCPITPDLQNSVFSRRRWWLCFAYKLGSFTQALILPFFALPFAFPHSIATLWKLRSFDMVLHRHVSTALPTASP